MADSDPWFGRRRSGDDAAHRDPENDALTLARTTALLAFLAAGCGRSTPLFPRLPVAADGGVVDAGQPLDAGVDAGPDAGPPTRCTFSVAPGSVDFGTVPLGTSVGKSVEVTNTGTAPCEFSSVGLTSDSDPGFSLAEDQSAALEIPVGGHSWVMLEFAAQSTDLPRARTGTLLLHRDGPPVQELPVPLQATIEVGCDLQVSPNPLDDGNVPLDTSVTDAVTLSNDGDEPCDISAVALDPTTSPLFSLAPSQATSFQVAAGASENISVVFDANDSADPHLRTGLLDFTVSQSSPEPAFSPTAMSIPLEAYINTACVVGSQWIYTVDSDGTFSIFNPQTLTFTDLGVLSCPDRENGTPFSMAVDQNAVAWVEYSSGNLFRVDTTTVACTATSFQMDPQLTDFGMGFVFQPTTGVDTLYVAGGPADDYGVTPPVPSTLGTIAFPSLALTSLATLNLGSAELTGTGDGQLWAFAPSADALTGVMTLAQIDPNTGAQLTTYTYPEITNVGAWAVKFWGGSFWLFLNSSIYQVDRNTGDITTAVADTGREIVGAGVSTCAPIQ